MKADGSFKSLLQGVSQQPVRDRLPGQATEQINMTADPVRSLSRRPGDDLVGLLGSDTDYRAYGTLVTPDGRKCIVKINGSGVRVFDYNGTEYVVNNPTGPAYFSNNLGKWSIATIKDKTYLANSGVPVRMRSGGRSYSNLGDASNVRYGGIIQVLGGQYGKTYSVTINNTTVLSFKTVSGDTASHSQWVGTVYLARVIEWLLTHAPGDTIPAELNNINSPYWNGAAMSGYVVTRKDDIIYIRKDATATAFRLTVSDDFANVNMKSMTDSVPDVADLPRYAPHNYAVRVAQETNPDEDLWLRFISDDSAAVSGQNFGDSGAWYETIAPGISEGFVKNTMPRIMTFDANTLQFNISENDWKDRTVGTETTNPTPSFVGYGINDITAFQSRLVMLGGPNLAASKSKKFEDFWIGSASTLTDADPIDLTSQSAFATVLQYVVPHNKDLVITSDKGQFILFGRSNVTPTNAALVLTTSFEVNLNTRPVPCGRNVFFTSSYGRYTGVREFYTEGGTDINDIRPITQHVNSYLVGQPAHISASSNYDTLLVHTTQGRTTVYVYQFIWSDNEKVQSAWSKWRFPKEVLYSFFDSEMVYFIMKDGATHILVRLSLDLLDEPGVGYPVHLGSRFDVSNVRTAFVLPLEWLSSQKLTVVQGAGCPNPGLPVGITSIAYSATELGYVVTLEEDMKGGSLVAGIPFLSDYWPTIPLMKDREGVPINNARLMMNQLLVSTEETGYIAGQKKTPWGTGPEVAFEGYSSDEVGMRVGRAVLSDKLFRMPIREKSTDFEAHFYSESHLPMTILDIEWQGTINKRGRRLSEGQ